MKKDSISWLDAVNGYQNPSVHRSLNAMENAQASSPTATLSRFLDEADPVSARFINIHGPGTSLFSLRHLPHRPCFYIFSTPVNEEMGVIVPSNYLPDTHMTNIQHGCFLILLIKLNSKFLLNYLAAHAFCSATWVIGCVL